MSRGLGRAARVGGDVVRHRVAAYAGVAAAVVGGSVALLVVVAMALAGVGPGLGTGALIVGGVALVAALVARTTVRRVPLGALAMFVARRIARRAGR